MDNCSEVLVNGIAVGCTFIKKHYLATAKTVSIVHFTFDGQHNNLSPQSRGKKK